MQKPEVNYVKTAYQSFPNLFFIGVMIFLSLVISPGFLFLLLAGELGVVLLAQSSTIRGFIEARAERAWKKEQERIENRIIAGLPEEYKRDFENVKQLCTEIEQRAAEAKQDKTSALLLGEIVEKLTVFRSEYARMLRARFLLANRNYKELRQRLELESKRLQDAVSSEQSEQVRTTIGQNLKILGQRLVKLDQLSEMVRLIEARLQVVRDSVQLIQEEVYSMTDVRGISSIVGDLLVNLEINEEFRSYYNDILSEPDSTLSALDSLDQMTSKANFTPKALPNQTK